MRPKRVLDEPTMVRAFSCLPIKRLRFFLFRLTLVLGYVLRFSTEAQSFADCKLFPGMSVSFGFQQFLEKSFVKLVFHPYYDDVLKNVLKDGTSWKVLYLVT